MASRGSLNDLVSVFPVILIAAVFVLLWQYGSVHRCIGCTEVEGWSKLEPVKSTILYRVNGADSGRFEAIFQNMLTTSIRINGISVADNLTASSSTCFIRTVEGVNESGNWTVVSVLPRAGFKILAACPAKKAGDSYDLQINITYSPVLGEVTAEQIESGRITGPIEYSKV